MSEPWKRKEVIGNATLYGTDLLGDIVNPSVSGLLSERFTFPPFSILDARRGEWQERKRRWKSLGINDAKNRSDIGAKCFGFDSEETERAESTEKIASVGENTTSFDPVLCELIYKWFSPINGQILDPFAGGPTRGIVASVIGRKYWGCDIREEQITGNIEQARNIALPIEPHWVCGDSMDKLNSAPESDLLFSCPPYGDLERYSNDPRDISTMEWHTFLAAYGRIILKATKRMKKDSFACFVVGDFRDRPGGFLKNFVGKTVEIFENVGCRLYNEAILVLPVGSASMRATKQFQPNRKLAKVHQNILVFCNGDFRAASDKCNE